MTADQRHMLLSLASEMGVSRGRINACAAIMAALDEIVRLKARVAELESRFGAAEVAINANPESFVAVIMPPYVRPEFHVDPDEGE